MRSMLSSWLIYLGNVLGHEPHRHSHEFGKWHREVPFAMTQQRVCKTCGYSESDFG